MRISRIQIANYRSIVRLDLAVDSYTALVGANGTGKSSVLYALQWFFEGGDLDLADCHGFEGPVESGDPPPPIEVTVTFADLTDRDRAKLEKYGRGSTATFSRIWQAGGRSKVMGNSIQGPNFVSVRRDDQPIGDRRAAYRTLREARPELPELPGNAPKDAMIDALVKWEADPVNLPLLVPVDADDATHLFGIGGTHVLKECVRVVLIPAASDISSEVGAAKKGTALDSLIGALMLSAGARAKQNWIDENSGIIEGLTASMLSSVNASTATQETRINDRLSNLIPNAKVQFRTEVPAWVPDPVATVLTDVEIDGTRNDVSRQGHGIQRAVMIAMFQSLVPDESLVRSQHVPVDNESGEQSAARLADALLAIPSLVVCIEEPEIYQHPVRARAFARVLAELAEQEGAQVLIATHSPYFARPDQFEGIRRFTLAAGTSRMERTTVAEIAADSGKPEDQVLKIVQKKVPTTFSEGFFADAVVLVEGDIDRAVVETLAERQGRPLDAAGISVLEAGGKGGITVPASILGALAIPTFIVFDGDFVDGDKPEARTSKRLQTESILERLPDSTARVGALPYEFGNPTVVSGDFAIWSDDIEGELAAWPSFLTALEASGHSLGEKNVLAVRAAVLESEMADVPASLDALITAVHDFRSRR